MVAVTIYSVTMVWWKETTFSLQSHGKALEKECLVCFLVQSGLHKRHSSSQPARLDRYGSGSSRTFCIK